MSDLAKTDGGLTQDQVAKLLADPILACPEALRPTVWKVWACYGHLLPSVMPLASIVGVWMRDRGLHPDDAKRVLNWVLRPERAAEFKFPSDLMTCLAANVSDAIRSRRSREERQRSADVQDGKQPSQRYAVDRLVMDIGKLP